MDSVRGGTAAVGQVECPVCLKRAVFRPALAGRKVKCPCGHVMVYPAGPTVDDGLYDLVEHPALPAPSTVPAAVGGVTRSAAKLAEPVRVTLPGGDGADPPDGGVAAAPPEVGMPAGVQQALLNRLGAMPRKSETKRALDGRRDARDAELEEMLRPSTTRDVVVPVAVILVGIALCAVQVRSYSHEPLYGTGDLLAAVMLKVTLSAGLMVAAMWFACTALDVNFMGSFNRAILRFAAIAVGPCAVYGILSHGGSVGGALLGTLVSVALYAVLFQGLMRTSLKDTGVCVAITWIFVAAAQYFADKIEAARTGALF